MGGWEEEESSEEEVAPQKVAPAPKRRFDGEDEEEEVAEDWDASSSEEEAPTSKTPAAAPKKKGTLKAAIAKKEAEKARMAAEEGDLDEDDSDVDEVEQKRRDKQRELETDLMNANSLLAGTSIAGKSSALAGITDFNPKTKDEFEELSNRLIALIKRHQEKPLYSMFVEMHVKALAQPLKDVDVRKSASALTALANEKQKEQRDKASGKKKPKAASKPALAGTRTVGRVDVSAYSEALDDFGDDDFM